MIRTVFAAVFISGIIGFSNLSSAAATASFDDLSLGSLTVPGVVATGGIDVTLGGPGTASIDSTAAVGRALRLTFGATATFDVPTGTSDASFFYYNVVSAQPTLTINSQAISFGGLSGTSGTIGGVDYTASGNPWGSFDQVDLTGPISSFAVTSAASPNSLIVDQVAFVPEPAGGVLVLGTAATVVLRRRAARPRGTQFDTASS